MSMNVYTFYLIQLNCNLRFVAGVRSPQQAPATGRRAVPAGVVRGAGRRGRRRVGRVGRAVALLADLRRRRGQPETDMPGSRVSDPT